MDKTRDVAGEGGLEEFEFMGVNEHCLYRVALPVC